MENEDRVRGLVYSENIERYIKEKDLFRGAHPKGKIYIPSAQFASGAQVGSALEHAGIPFVSEPTDDAALPTAREEVGATDNSDDVDGIPPALTSDSDKETDPKAIFRSPLTAFPSAFPGDEESDEGLPKLIPVDEGAEVDCSPDLPPPFLAPVVHDESVVGRSYMPASEAAQSLLPDGIITPFELPLPSIPLAARWPQPRFSLYRPLQAAGAGLVGAIKELAQATPHNPFIVMPPSRIPVPGTEQFIFLGGVVNSRFTEIMSQADVTTRKALVINAYQTEPRSDETPLHERLRDEVAALQETHRTSNLADVDYHHVDLQDIIDAPVNDHIFTTALLIDEALASNRQVFVYCGKGVSRSATLVLGYLILAKNMTNDEANEYVCQQRAVAPNLGFGIALYNLARYSSGIGSREETLSKITLAEKILAIQAIIRADQETSRAVEPASPVSPSALAVPLARQPLRADSYGACCGGGHSFRHIEQPGTNPLSLSLGASAPRSWSYRASGSHPGFDPVFDDRRREDDQPDYCFAHSVSNMHWLHQPARVLDHPNQDGPLPPLPGSTEAEEPKSSGSPTV